MTEAQIEHMVQRFLGWGLPENFYPDGGISFTRIFNEDAAYPLRNEPTGTNLFDATQTAEMVRHMIDGLPSSMTMSELRAHQDSAKQSLADTRARAKDDVETRVTVSIYLDDGIVFEYGVKNATSAREHVSAIIKTGYRHSDSETPDEMTHFPPHRILKVKMRGPGITTMYYDRPRGT